MSSKATVKMYRLALYTAQFAVSPKWLSKLSDSLPKLLTEAHVTDQSTRIKLIEWFRTIIADFESLHDESSEQFKLTAATSRAFIRRFVAVFGIITTLATLRNLATKLKHPTALLTAGELTIPAKYAASLGILASSFPLVNSKIKDAAQAGLVVSSLSLPLLPEGPAKDYISIYAFVQALEALVHKYAEKLPYNFESYWFLAPLCLSQLFEQATSSPQYLSGIVTRIAEWLYGGLVEPKPVWYLADWPRTIDTFIQVKRAKRVNRGLIHEEIVVTRTNPSHTNAKFAVLSPSNPHILTVLKNTIPKKGITLFSISLAAFYLYYSHQKKNAEAASSLTTTANPSVTAFSTSVDTSLDDEYNEVGESNADILTKESSLLQSKVSETEHATTPSLTTADDSRGVIRNALASSSKFTATTLATLITSYVLLTARVPPRVNGLISGLWWYAYRRTASAPLFITVARITLLGFFKEQRDKNSVGHNGVWGLLMAKWSASRVGIAAVTLLVAMRAEGCSLGRFDKYVEYLTTGGGVKNNE